MIEIKTIGGYDEVGRNMTAVRVNDEVIILDMGLHLENYIRCTDDEDVIKVSQHDLMEAQAVPDISLLGDWKGKVKAIVPSHVHLDHIGAVPFLWNEFRAPVICTPFAAAVLRKIMKDEKIQTKNKLVKLNPNSTHKVSGGISVEFLSATHSTPQTVIVALHTKHGAVLYANDFKFDMTPTLGPKPNMKRLEIGRAH